MEIQRCGHCREEKDLAEFSPSYRGRPGTWCKACKRALYVPKPPAAKVEIPEGHGHCFKCDTVKPLDEFYSGINQKSWCRECYRAWHRKRYVPKNGATDDPRECSVCGKTYKPKHRKISLYCSRECLQVARKISGREREAYLQRTYGIGAADYDRMLVEQGGGCALCGIKPEELTSGRFRTYLHVDHDAITGRVRGLLCPDHNLLIGRWNHDPVLLRRAADYLEAAGARVSPPMVLDTAGS
jgi:hypothetical protein